MFLSPSSNSNPSWALTVCAIMLACVSSTPLGRPVVPDEYMMMATSSGSTSSARPVGVAAASIASYSSPSPPSGVTVMTCSTLVSLSRILSIAWLEFRADDQQLGAGVVEHVVELVGGQPEVDDRVGGAERRGGERQLDTGRMVLVQERHHVAAFDATLLERACQPAHPVVPLGPGPGPVEVDERLGVGFGLRPVGGSLIEK